MDKDFAIRVENVSKKYCKSLKKSMMYGLTDIGRNMIGLGSHPGRIRGGEFWALDDVSFEIKRGDTLGLIGPNGSGKTTLLKMLNGIFWPDKGKITLKGRVGALIAVGAGLHPLLTGRENVYINGAILGMSKREIDQKFDAIVEFADIGDFLDAPVKHYSSGMFVRLGFAVAIHCEPDILLVDEVLAVGDSNFIIKSLNKVNSMIKEHGMTVIFVSHSNTMIRAVCKKALYLERGLCKKMGNTEEVVEEYEYDSLHKREKVLQKGYQRIKSDFRAEIDKVLLLDKNNCEKDSFKIGDFLKIRVHLNASEILEEPAVQIAIFNEKGQCLLSQISKTDNFVIPPILGRLYVDFSIEEIPFNAGAYSLSAKLINGNLINTIDYHINSRRIKMESDGKIGYDGILYLNGNWAVSNE